MIGSRDRARRASFFALAVAAGFMFEGLTVQTRAEDVSAANPEVERIVKALGGVPEGKTRSFSIHAKSPLSPEQRAIVEAAKKKGTRGLSLGERGELAEATQTLPSIDLEVYFDFDSDQVNGASQDTVNALGKALTNSSFAGSTFVVSGHTDAKGSNDYNQQLSQRRAEAVRHLLIERFDLNESHLIAIGYGEEQLKFPTNPEGDQNRRVQIVNLGE